MATGTVLSEQTRSMSKRVLAKQRNGSFNGDFVRPCRQFDCALPVTVSFRQGLCSPDATRVRWQWGRRSRSSSCCPGWRNCLHRPLRRPRFTASMLRTLFILKSRRRHRSPSWGRSFGSDSLPGTVAWARSIQPSSILVWSRRQRVMLHPRRAPKAAPAAWSCWTAFRPSWTKLSMGWTLSSWSA